MRDMDEIQRELQKGQLHQAINNKVRDLTNHYEYYNPLSENERRFALLCYAVQTYCATGQNPVDVILDLK